MCTLIKEKYISQCPYVKDTECQACEEGGDYNRILVCYKCLKQGRKELAVDTCKTAWTASNENERAAGNHPKQCNGFIFCTDCIRVLGIKGACKAHEDKITPLDEPPRRPRSMSIYEPTK